MVQANWILNPTPKKTQQKETAAVQALKSLHLKGEEDGFENHIVYMNDDEKV